LLSNLASVSRSSGIEIKVKSNIAVGKETLPQLKEIISKRENQKRCVRSRTHLVIE